MGGAQCRRDAGRQSAAAAVDGDGIGGDLAGGQLCHDLQARRALSGHDCVIVIGMNQGQALFFCDFPRHLAPVFGIGVVQDDGGAPPAAVVDLHPRGDVGQDDGGLAAHQPGGSRHGLSVIACGEGDHALGAILFGQREDLVQCAAQLERSRRLQSFGFQEQLETQFAVELGGAQERSLDNMGRQQCGGLLNGLKVERSRHVACLGEGLMPLYRRMPRPWGWRVPRAVQA